MAKPNLIGEDIILDLLLRQVATDSNQNFTLGHKIKNSLVLV